MSNEQWKKKTSRRARGGAEEKQKQFLFYVNPALYRVFSHTEA